MPLKHTSDRAILIIFSLLIIVVGSAGFALVLRPGLERFRIARDDFNTAAEEIKGVEETLAKMKAVTGQASKGAPAEIEKLKEMFIGSPELAFILTTLSKYAEATRFLISSLDFDSSTVANIPSKGSLRQIPVHLQLTGGGYGELKEFLARMTKSTPIYEVTSFTFNPGSATTSINFSAFSIQEDTASSVQLDPEFFNDARFKALYAPIPLPKKDPVGKTNPFAAQKN